MIYLCKGTILVQIFNKEFNFYFFFYTFHDSWILIISLDDIIHSCPSCELIFLKILMLIIRIDCENWKGQRCVDVPDSWHVALKTGQFVAYSQVAPTYLGLRQVYAHISRRFRGVALPINRYSSPSNHRYTIVDTRCIQLHCGTRRLHFDAPC